MDSENVMISAMNEWLTQVWLESASRVSFPDDDPHSQKIHHAQTAQKASSICQQRCSESIFIQPTKHLPTQYHQ